LEYLAILIAGTLSGILSGIVGTGASLIMMPILVLAFGPQQAVPVMAIASVMGNLGKVLAWRRQVDWRACGAYCATAVPAAAIGVRTLLELPTGLIEIALGVFFLAMIPLRRWLARHSFRFTLWHMALIGVPVGFLTGIVVSTGPITVPVFTSYGLERGAFVATEAAASLAVYAAKVATFQGLGALPLEVIANGLFTGIGLMAGAFISRRILLRMTPPTFRLLIDGLMLVSGVAMLWVAFR
jgi:uncharacterized protein